MNRSLQVVVLGAGAGGGLPQWNCGCCNCSDARRGIIPAMTQSSIAVSADGKHWVILNASPDIRTQLQACVDMHPESLRGTPVSAVFLTNGDIDHIAGLLTLREKSGFRVLGTEQTLGILRENTIFKVLDAEQVEFLPLSLDQLFEPVPGLLIEPFAVPGKVPLYQETDDLRLNAMGEQTVGLRIGAGDSVLYYIPGCAEIPDWLIERVSDGDMILFDGTVWKNDEMRATGTGTKSGARMGHIAMAGPQGSLSRFKALRDCQKIYIHINNTNPVLQPKAPERALVESEGWAIAQDGMRFQL
ncbi:pyrroloquinoline quinone biosynthesis protein PqqB [uncultured Microbulbifer sp.]|uniref:pyrroloquinoline quinone biosynthesis protein PqqB n=1 Tax=uncultured Microbulbifer sp. TaxID=348147 RepID=UPI0026186EFA|nr:pyrroloquinoline quinone biosynthesis protein PqqB [uncultured Microbulbifer sp.]